LSDRRGFSLAELLSATVVMLAFIFLIALFGNEEFDVYLDLLVIGFVSSDFIMDLFLSKYEGMTVSRIALFWAKRKGGPIGYGHTVVGYFLGILLAGILALLVDNFQSLFLSSTTNFFVLTLYAVCFFFGGFYRLINTDRTHHLPRPSKTEGGERPAGVE
jgi:hypothetical protein